MIEPECPAEGVLKKSGFDDQRRFMVACQCETPKCHHEVNVEISNHREVYVTIYSTLRTKWNVPMWKLIWKLLTRGYIEYEESIVLTKQQAINYAAALTTAVNELSQTTRD